MLAHESVPLPVCTPGTRRERLIEDIRHWVSSPPMRLLVTAFGESLPDTTTDALLDWLDQFSEIHWDFRKGRLERHMVSPTDFDETLSMRIEDAAIALGLVDARPPAAAVYDHILILGGLAAACRQRAAFAAHLVHTSAVTVPAVAALSSYRPLHEGEADEPRLAGCDYEVDAMAVEVRTSFHLADPREERHATVSRSVNPESWSIRTFDAPDGLVVQVLAAPSSEPSVRRANTSDTYRFWAKERRIGPQDRVLVVTSPIYVPFQHCDAVRMLGLPYGCGVDTVGFDRTVFDTSRLLAGRPDRYLQEIRSAIRSMRNLYFELATSDGHGGRTSEQRRTTDTAGTAL